MPSSSIRIKKKSPPNFTQLLCQPYCSIDVLALKVSDLIYDHDPEYALKQCLKEVELYSKALSINKSRSRTELIFLQNIFWLEKISHQHANITSPFFHEQDEKAVAIFNGELHRVLTELAKNVFGILTSNDNPANMRKPTKSETTTAIIGSGTDLCDIMEIIDLFIQYSKPLSTLLRIWLIQQRKSHQNEEINICDILSILQKKLPCSSFIELILGLTHDQPFLNDFFELNAEKQASLVGLLLKHFQKCEKPKTPDPSPSTETIFSKLRQRLQNFLSLTPDREQLEEQHKLYRWQHDSVMQSVLELGKHCKDKPPLRLRLHSAYSKNKDNPDITKKLVSIYRTLFPSKRWLDRWPLIRLYSRYLQPKFTPCSLIPIASKNPENIGSDARIFAAAAPMIKRGRTSEEIISWIKDNTGSYNDKAEYVLLAFTDEFELHRDNGLPMTQASCKMLTLADSLPPNVQRYVIPILDHSGISAINEQPLCPALLAYVIYSNLKILEKGGTLIISCFSGVERTAVATCLIHAFIHHSSLFESLKKVNGARPITKTWDLLKPDLQKLAIGAYFVLLSKNRNFLEDFLKLPRDVIQRHINVFNRHYSHELSHSNDNKVIAAFNNVTVIADLQPKIANTALFPLLKKNNSQLMLFQLQANIEVVIKRWAKYPAQTLCKTTIAIPLFNNTLLLLTNCPFQKYAANEMFNRFFQKKLDEHMIVVLVLIAKQGETIPIKALENFLTSLHTQNLSSLLQKISQEELQSITEKLSLQWWVEIFKKPLCDEVTDKLNKAFLEIHPSTRAKVNMTMQGSGYRASTLIETDSRSTRCIAIKGSETTQFPIYGGLWGNGKGKTHQSSLQDISSGHYISSLSA